MPTREKCEKIMRLENLALCGICRGAVYRIFTKGGRTWSMSKRGGARLFVAAGQPQGGGGFKGGQE